MLALIGALAAALVSFPAAEGNNDMGPATDITDSDLGLVIDFAAEVDAPDPLVPLCVWKNESDLRTDAWNHNGGASGLFQAMPATLKGLGYRPELGDDGAQRSAAFRAESWATQIKWATRYYRPHRGKLVNRVAFYVATFLPADLDYAAHGNENTVLVAKDGRRGWAFDANAGFDADGDLTIRVGELDEAIVRACHGPRWDDIESRMRRIAGMPPVPPAPHPAPLDLTTVRGVQEALRALGYNLEADGYPGPITRTQLAAFQRSRGLAADARPGPNTRAALQAALEAAQVA